MGHHVEREHTVYNHENLLARKHYFKKFDIFYFRIALKRKNTVRNRLRAFSLLYVEKTKVEKRRREKKKSSK